MTAASGNARRQRLSNWVRRDSAGAGFGPRAPLGDGAGEVGRRGGGRRVEREASERMEALARLEDKHAPAAVLSGVGLSKALAELRGEVVGALELAETLLVAGEPEEALLVVEEARARVKRFRARALLSLARQGAEARFMRRRPGTPPRGLLALGLLWSLGAGLSLSLVSRPFIPPSSPAEVTSLSSPLTDPSRPPPERTAVGGGGEAFQAEPRRPGKDGLGVAGSGQKGSGEDGATFGLCPCSLPVPPERGGDEVQEPGLIPTGTGFELSLPPLQAPGGPGGGGPSPPVGSTLSPPRIPLRGSLGGEGSLHARVKGPAPRQARSEEGAGFRVASPGTLSPPLPGGGGGPPIAL